MKTKTYSPIENEILEEDLGLPQYKIATVVGFVDVSTI